MPDEFYLVEPSANNELYRLAMRLRARNPIRQLALKHLCKMPLPDDALNQLLKAMACPSGFRRKEQELAVTLLGHLRIPANKRHHVCLSLQNILSTKQWEDYVGLYVARVGIMGLLATLVVQISYDLPWNEQSLLELTGRFISFCIIAALPMLPVSAIFEDKRVNRLRAAAVRTCGRLQLVELLETVAAALFDAPGAQQTLGCHMVRDAAAEALPPLLSALNEQHYLHLPTETVPNLCKALYHNDDLLVMRVLEALEKVGDGRAVFIVERMVKKGRTAELRAAAERILPILQERQRQENAPKMLLRASSAPAETPDALLRPAMYTGETEPETLLRAGELRK